MKYDSGRGGMVRALIKQLKDDRGMATSLLETVLVVAIVAVLSSVALVSGIDNLEQARFSRATADTEQIGIAVHTFMQDNGFAPAFKSGAGRDPNDAFLVLESTGDEPAVEESFHWPSDAAARDLLENQLIKNRPDGTAAPYPRVGEISWNRHKGWNGPYLGKIPSSDPWNDKYLVNIQMIMPQGVQKAAPELTVEAGRHAAVFVISAGPNRKLETRFDQVSDAFASSGDDIVFRIQ